MYRICTPDALTALAYNVVDPQQFLFDGAGVGLAATDDIVQGVDHRSRLTYTAVEPGVHYLPFRAGTESRPAPPARSSPTSVRALLGRPARAAGFPFRAGSTPVTP
jgi:hypothetical protein